MVTTTETRLPLAVAERVAAELVALLAPYAERIEVAGSIRRRRPLVKDVELVVIPRQRPMHDLFGEVRGYTDQLHEHVAGVVAAGVLAKRLDVNGRPRFGPSAKYLRFGDVPVDLFCGDHDTFGLDLFIRTGPGSWNERVLAQRGVGGTVMPFGMQCQGGRLWRNGQPLATPEERDVFAALGIAYVEPWERA